MFTTEKNFPMHFRPSKASQSQKQKDCDVKLVQEKLVCMDS